MKGKLVCFTGIDGAGKTTLIRITINRLKAKGITFNYAYGSHLLFLLKPVIVIGKRLFFKNRDASNDYGAYVSSANRVGGNSFLSTCYQSAVLIEYLIQAYFKVTWPLLLGKNIILDRYFYDTIINMKINLGFNEKTLNKMIKALSIILPTPDVIYFVDVPEEVSFSRKTDTPSIDYLKARRGFYKKIAENYHAIFLDGTKKIDDLYTLIEESII